MPNSKNNQLSKNKKKSLLPHGFKAKAERISEGYRKYLALNKNEPLPSQLLTNFLKVHVKELESVESISPEIINDLLDGFESSFSAVTIYCTSNNRYMIVHNHTHSSARRESNIMHECAHIILEHKMEEFDNTNGFNLRKYNEVQEEEAKYLGHCLQLPKSALTQYYVYEKKSREEIAEQFNASMPVVNYRIRICGMENFKKFIDKRSNNL